MECINLRNTYGDRYRVRLEEPAKSFGDPWYHLIPCRYGHIYPHGRDRLGFASDRVGPIVRRVAALSTARVEQMGDDGWNVTFNVSEFDRVAEIVQPRRRRRLSEQHRVALVEAGRPHRLMARG